MTVTSGIAKWLREQRQARGWTKRELARKLIAAGRAAGDHMPDIDDMWRYVHRWETGETGITERYSRHYCTVFGISPTSFGTAPLPQRPAMPAVPVPAQPSASALLAQPSAPGFPAQASAQALLAQPSAWALSAQPPAPVSAPLAPAVPAAAALAGLPLPASTVVAYRVMDGSGVDDLTMAQGVLMAAQEASAHADEHDSGIGQTTLEQLREDVARMARAYDTGEPFAVFLDMRRVRERIYRVLDRRQGPRQQTGLYLLLGCLNGLMGKSVNHLGYPDAGEELIRAGWGYANAIDHNPLRGWLRTALFDVMYDRGRFEASRDLAAGGLTYLSAGPLGADLYLAHARAAARLGDAGTARRAVQQAHDARDPDYTDDLVEMGGTFLISQATHYCAAGTALTVLAGAERDATEALEQAISLYNEGPRGREDHWFAGKPLAGISLAMVRLRSGALDAAAAALQPALSLPAGQRINRVTARLAAVREELAAPVFRNSTLAKELGEQIEEFDREAIAASLGTS